MAQEIEVSFFTKYKEFAIPDFSVSVPRSSGKDKLNEIVNALLNAEKEDGEDSQLFDFLINDEYLISSIKKHLEDTLSKEEHVGIEYIPRQLPPIGVNEITTNDYVSSVHTMGKYVIAGSFDNSVHIGTVHEEEPILVLPAHSKPVKSVRWVCNSSVQPPEGAMFVTASYDQTARLWHWDFESNQVHCVFEGKGHRGTVMTCSASRPDGCGPDGWPLMATGSWDKTLKIWSLKPDSDLSEETGGIPHKRRCRDRAPTRIPLRTFDGHKEAVSCVIWKDDPHELVSCSWDRSLRIWDAETGDEKACINHARVTAFNSVAYSPHNGLLLTAANDTFIRVFDPRSRGEGANFGQDLSAMKAHYSGHSRLVFSVAWAPHKDNQFVSGSVDCTAKLWDTRNTRACLYDIQDHAMPVTDVDWTEREFILSASEDRSVKVYKYRE